jgi:hypothetical protein
MAGREYSGVGMIKNHSRKKAQNHKRNEGNYFVILCFFAAMMKRG